MRALSLFYTKEKGTMREPCSEPAILYHYEPVQTNGFNTGRTDKQIWSVALIFSHLAGVSSIDTSTPGLVQLLYVCRERERERERSKHKSSDIFKPTVFVSDNKTG